MLLKKLFIIFVLSIYVVSLTEVHQLIKLPLLVQHFIEHKEKDTELSLWQFLNMHYAQTDDHDGDAEKDMKLPFKSHDGCIGSLIVAFVPSNFEGIVEKPFYVTSNVYLTYTDKFIQPAYLSSIWQPPKFC